MANDLILSTWKKENFGNNEIMNMLYKNVPHRETASLYGKKRVKFPPWGEDFTKLYNVHLPNADRQKIYDQRWLLQKKNGNFEYHHIGTSDNVSQLNPRKKQYVVRIEENGPRTEVWKHRKIIAEWGPDLGQKRFPGDGDGVLDGDGDGVLDGDGDGVLDRVKHRDKSGLAGLADRWSRLGRGAKCGIITSAVVIIIGMILTAVLVPLYAACKNGSLTGTVCKNLGA